jgi:S1-C subfamily serine protease
MIHYQRPLFCGLICVGFGVLSGPALAQKVDPRVMQEQSRRIALIEKVRPTVVAIFAHGGQGGGSGVLISRDGYTLTNFHVVQGSGNVMQCGLPNGVLYDAVLVGQDKVGDVALIKLLPKNPGDAFPAATLGDSDKVRTGDWSLAMGNPFLLATDFTPTVTFGLVSGVHRYQYPESSRGLLEYTDCIQVDTSINPGNSGGPLFNLQGELIGINGRISLEKRGRVNSGVGYAISINQIKNFLGHLRAGLDVDHASLGAIIENRDEESLTKSGMVVTQILEDCDAHRRGLELNDELVSFAGRPITNQNHFKNVLGLFPKGWRVPLVYRRENVKHEILVRLMGVQRPESEETAQRSRPPLPRPGAPGPPADSPANKLFEAKKGFANYYFNKLERNRLLAGCRKRGDFSSLAGTWVIEADFEFHGQRSPARIVIGEEEPASGKGKRTLVHVSLPARFDLDPLKAGQKTEDLEAPPGTGGLLMALYQYRRLLILGEKGFEGNFSHGGNEPLYRLLTDGAPHSYADQRVDTEVLNTEHAAIPAKWFFTQNDQALLGAEVSISKDKDPCELYFSGYTPVNGRLLPGRIDVRYGNGQFGTFLIKNYQCSPK